MQIHRSARIDFNFEDIVVLQDRVTASEITCSFTLSTTHIISWFK
jgi:hypothetical protein